jgi:hypothetical protein
MSILKPILFHPHPLPTGRQATLSRQGRGKKSKLDLTTYFTLCYFEFCQSTRGAVAQLGERLNGIQEADGSIPFSSTIYFTKYKRNR